MAGPDATTIFQYLGTGVGLLGGGYGVFKMVLSGLSRLNSQTSLTVTEAGSREDVILTLNRQVDRMEIELKQVKEDLKKADDDARADSLKIRQLEADNWTKDQRIARLEAQVKSMQGVPVS